MGYLRLFFKVKSPVHTISGRIKNGWDQKLFGLGLHDLLYPVALYTKSGGTGKSDRLPVGQFRQRCSTWLLKRLTSGTPGLSNRMHFT